MDDVDCVWNDVSKIKFRLFIFQPYHDPTKILPNFEMPRNVLKCSAEALHSCVVVYLFNSTWVF